MKVWRAIVDAVATAADNRRFRRQMRAEAKAAENLCVVSAVKRLNSQVHWHCSEVSSALDSTQRNP